MYLASSGIYAFQNMFQHSKMDVVQKYEWVVMLMLQENVFENRACRGEDNPMSLQLLFSITGGQGDICEVFVLPQLLHRIY